MVSLCEKFYSPVQECVEYVKKEKEKVKRKCCAWVLKLANALM